MHLQYLKKVSNETEESKGLRPATQKDEKRALFCNSVNSIISSGKFSFKEKNYLNLIISFNFSNKTFMQKGTDQSPFNFFQFWYPKSICLFKVLLYCLNQLIEDRQTFNNLTKKHYCQRNFYRSSCPEVFCKKGVLNPLTVSFTKWSNTLKQFFGNLPTNFLSVFGHFVGLALKELRTQQNKLLQKHLF